MVIRITNTIMMGWLLPVGMRSDFLTGSEGGALLSRGIGIYWDAFSGEVIEETASGLLYMSQVPMQNGTLWVQQMLQRPCTMADFQILGARKVAHSMQRDILRHKKGCNYNGKWYVLYIVAPACSVVPVADMYRLSVWTLQRLMFFPPFLFVFFFLCGS